MSAATSSSLSTPNSSLWKLPGLDKDNFYAAALLLSVLKGNINVGRHYREPKTPEATRDFLDHLADCFARSKLQDRGQHVSATAMVRNEKQKTITLYIAKNKSEKRIGPSESLENREVVKNENDDFAKILIAWFNLSDGEAAAQPDDNDLHDQSAIFKMMCDFNTSRLEFYIQEIRKADVDALDFVVEIHLDDKFRSGWEKAKGVITKCQDYEPPTKDSEITCEEVSLLRCAQLAGQARENADFQKFASAVETSPESKRSKVEGLTSVAGGIKYLGRLFAAYKHFQHFCDTERRKGFSFVYKLLSSLDWTWNGDTYLEKIESWDEILDLSKVQRSTDSQTDPDVLEKISDIVKNRNNKALVHCEMQPLMHFSGPNAEKCEDYFGCSKKSCWLCWQMMLKNSRYIMKDTHRKIYPAWVFPFDYSASQPTIAEGLITAYNTMLSLVQESLIKRTPLTFLEPLAQSSFRMTPAYRCGPLNPNSDKSAKSELFPGSLITVPDRWPAYTVRAVHLPEHGSSTDSRMVEIHAYECAKSELTHPAISFKNFDNKTFVFAFQVMTNPQSLSLDSNIEDYQRAHWESALFGNIGQPPWTMFFRTAYETLGPNPYISSLCATTEPEISQPIPWREDILIIQGEKHGGIDFRSEFSFDEGACLKALEDRLRSRPEKWDPDKAAKDAVEIADISLECYKIQLLLDAVKRRHIGLTTVDERKKSSQKRIELREKLRTAEEKEYNNSLSQSQFYGL